MEEGKSAGGGKGVEKQQEVVDVGWIILALNTAPLSSQQYTRLTTLYTRRQLPPPPLSPGNYTPSTCPILQV